MYYILAFLVGGIIIVQMMINSTLSTKLGKLSGVFYNYFTASLIMVIFYLFNFNRLKALDISDKWSLLGGTVGILIVSICNYVLPKMSALYATVLIMLGQLVTANILEYLLTGDISIKKVLGCMLILTGILSNVYFDKKT